MELLYAVSWCVYACANVPVIEFVHVMIHMKSNHLFCFHIAMKNILKMGSHFIPLLVISHCTTTMLTRTRSDPESGNMCITMHEYCRQFRVELSDSGNQSIIVIAINNRDLDSILSCYCDYLSISLSQKYG